MTTVHFSKPQVRMVDLVVISIALIFGLAFGVLLQDVRSVNAHSAISYYDRDWATDPSVRLGNLDYELDGTSTYRSRTLARTNEARSEWNNVAGPMDFNSAYWSTTINWTGSSCTTALWGNVTAVRNNISALATTNRCGTSSNITRTSIRFDYRAWENNGTPSSSEYDFRSVMTHELGHATGFGDSSADHFSGSSTCPSNEVLRNTMCSGYGAGDVYKRSIESHDKHTFDAAG